MFILHRLYIETAFVCLATWGMIESEAHAQHAARSQRAPAAHHTPVAARPQKAGRHAARRARDRV